MGKKTSARWDGLPPNLKDRIITPDMEKVFEKPDKPTKYHNKKCEYDGHKFDSQKERDYYIKLKSQLGYDGIIDFTCQPEFKYLVTYSTPNGRSFEKWYKYIADFQVNYRDGHSEVVDIKGTWKGSLTPEFKRKRMIIKKLYGIEIKIV